MVRGLALSHPPTGFGGALKALLAVAIAIADRTGFTFILRYGSTEGIAPKVIGGTVSRFIAGVLPGAFGLRLPAGGSGSGYPSVGIPRQITFLALIRGIRRTISKTGLIDDAAVLTGCRTITSFSLAELPFGTGKGSAHANPHFFRTMLLPVASDSIVAHPLLSSAYRPRTDIGDRTEFPVVAQHPFISRPGALGLLRLAYLTAVAGIARTRFDALPIDQAPSAIRLTAIIEAYFA